MTAEGGILGPIVSLLGWLMNIIFEFLNIIKVPNIGLAIILFTIVMYILLLPLTIKQQKFSKMSARMNPELMAIRKKYQNKKDQASMMAMNDETKRLYEKYGVSPTGSCLPLLIQMPILLSLYRVIYAIPAYVTRIKDIYQVLAEKIIAQDGGVEFISKFKTSESYTKQFSAIIDGTQTDPEIISNTVIDALNKASTTDFESIGTQFSGLKDIVGTSFETLTQYNTFLGLNISNSPSHIISEAFANGAFLLILGALLIPILAAATQWINTKLMPQPANTSNSSGPENSMMASMKVMTTVMPLMSAFFCFSFASGIGIYWIAGSVVRSIQQVLINKHLDKIDMDALMKKNSEKMKKKNEKFANYQQSLNERANMNTKYSSDSNNVDNSTRKADAIKRYNDSVANSKKSASSISEKASMVKNFNEKNNKN